MSRNGSGTYSLPVNSWNPAVNGTPATASDWQTLINDVALAITQSLSRDGQTVLTGNLQMGNNKLTGLSVGSAAGDSLAWQQLFSQGQPADLASAATTDIGLQNTTVLNITGTTTITSFGINYNGPRFLRFAGVLTLTHNATTLILPGGANITTAANDCAIVVPSGTPANGWRVVGYMRADGTGGVQTNVREYVSVFDYMTAAEIADVQSYTGAINVSGKVNAAIQDAMERQKNLYCPSGKYNVANLEIPPAGYAGPDYRTLGFRIYGDGQGQIFARTAIVGTVFSCTTDNTILTVKNLASPAVGTSGNIEIDHIRFEANSNTVPAVYLQTFYGQSKFDSCGIYQDGTGDGLQVDYIATGQITNNYIINGDWANFGPVVRTGCGIRFEQNFDGGLATFYKNTCRGFADGFIIGDGIADPSAVRLEQNECSVVANGVTINSMVSGCVLDTNYFEGVEGTCVVDNGKFTKVLNSQMYNGFAIGIDGSETSTYGSLYQGNYIETSGIQPCTLIKVGSAGTFGGPNKTVTANHLLFSTSGGVVPGVIGIEKIGNNPRFNIFGNAFDPRGPWVGGAGTIKILDSTTGEGTYGLDVVPAGDYEFPQLAHGAVSLGRNPNALTESNVSANTLTLPNNSSLFNMAATVATTVNVIDGGNHVDKLIVFQLDNANTTFQKGAQMLLASNFSGPGTLTVLTYTLGASKFAIEIARTTI